MATYDLVFTNATLVDGTGAPLRTASVGVRDDTIVAVGDVKPDGAGRLVDASGLVLAPGFIDMHTHSDRTLLVDPDAQSKVQQGVTTEMVGNCGSSPTPCVGAVAEEERKRLARWGVEPTWRTMAEYLRTLEERGVGINVMALVGHGSVRKAAMGYAMRPADAGELAEIRWLVAESMAGGAVGMSFGGIYPPSNYADTQELIEASKEVAAANGIYACHMRNEREGLLDAVRESIRIGRESGAAVQISHHKASSPRVWGLVNESLALIEQAHDAGLDVTFDQYPYRASSTNLNAMLPPWAHEGGPAGMLARLRDPAERTKIPGRPAERSPKRDRRQPDARRHPDRELSHRPLARRQDDRSDRPRARHGADGDGPRRPRRERGRHRGDLLLDERG
ncbi:MAG: amidohydrolase family protein [Chloroflexota bacterium]|nr:amidohydrolase family protein [Chloroflexota bacterium]